MNTIIHYENINAIFMNLEYINALIMNYEYIDALIMNFIIKCTILGGEG